jgi:undecaprenyl-diphosphatase
MIDFLYSIDVQIFYFINVFLANPVTDKVMPFITERENWYIFFFVMWFTMVIKGGKRGRIAAVMVIVSIIVSDQISSTLIKHLVQRPRPCMVLQGVHLLVPCLNSYSFPSSHAVNFFSGAVVISHFFPEYKISIYGASFLIALSRVFVGVHYPSDMVGGIAIGILIGMLLIFLWSIVNKGLKIDYKKKK